MKNSLLLFTLIFAFGCKAPTSSVDSTEAPSINHGDNTSVIAFGSCADEDETQPMWPYVVANQPDLWVWLGDIIYGDSDDPNKFKNDYIELNNITNYQKLKATCPIIGTWDDHDYGINNGGKEWQIKKETKKELLDFFEVPETDPRRKREGVYHSYSFGEKGKKVKVILLDCRYFRDSSVVGADRQYILNETGTILGEAQWQWLENELTNSDAQVHIIGSGIQVIAEDHRFEKWANFPNERKRLFDLFEKTKPAHLIIISGDRHLAELSKIDIGGQSLYDITSSGITHSYTKVNQNGETNRHRVENHLTGNQNFGLIIVDWSKTPIEIRTEVKGIENQVWFSEKLEF